MVTKIKKRQVQKHLAFSVLSVHYRCHTIAPTKYPATNYGPPPTPIRVRSEGHGLSHALKNMPPACFSPRLCRGRAFKSRDPIRKSALQMQCAFSEHSVHYRCKYIAPGKLQMTTKNKKLSFASFDTPNYSMRPYRRILIRSNDFFQIRRDGRTCNSVCNFVYRIK